MHLRPSPRSGRHGEHAELPTVPTAGSHAIQAEQTFPVMKAERETWGSSAV